MEGWMVWAYYGLLAGLTWWFKQPKERRGEMWEKVTVSLHTRLQTQAISGAAAVLRGCRQPLWPPVRRAVGAVGRSADLSHRRAGSSGDHQR